MLIKRATRSSWVPAYSHGLEQLCLCMKTIFTGAVHRGVFMCTLYVHSTLQLLTIVAVQFQELLTLSSVAAIVMAASPYKLEFIYGGVDIMEVQSWEVLPFRRGELIAT